MSLISESIIFSENISPQSFSVCLEHKKRLQSAWLRQPNFTSGIPPLNLEIFEDQELDKGVSGHRK